jgi:hypothetical protein
MADVQNWLNQNYGDMIPYTNNPNKAPAGSGGPNTVGGRTGISAYNGIGLPEYKDPYDVQGFKDSKYYGIATGDSMSPWSKLAAEQQNKLAAQKNAAAKANGQGMAAKTASSLAQQGGLTSGARERAQEQSGKNILSMVQGNNEDASNNIANIGIEDAKQRMGMIGDATGKLTSMSAGNIQGQNTYNKDITSMLNQAVSSDQTARAQIEAAHAQGGLSLILLVSGSLLGSLSPSEAKASERLSGSSTFTRLKEARKAFGSENALRGYCKVSDMLSPKIERSVMGKKAVYYAMVKPVAKKGILAKVWGHIFGLIGKVV